MTPCGATLAASHQEATEIQAWFQAFDMRGKKKCHFICAGALEAESRHGETGTQKPSLNDMVAPSAFYSVNKPSKAN